MNNYKTLVEWSRKSLLAGLERCIEIEDWLARDPAVDKLLSELRYRISLHTSAFSGDKERDAEIALNAAGKAAHKLCGLCVSLCRESRDPSIKRWQGLRSRVDMAILRRKRLLQEARREAGSDPATPSESAVTPDRTTEILEQLVPGSILVRDGSETNVLRIDGRLLRVQTPEGEIRTMLDLELPSYTLKPSEPPAPSEKTFSFIGYKKPGSA